MGRIFLIRKSACFIFNILEESKMKKLLAVILAVVMVAAFAACTKTPVVDDTNAPADENVEENANAPADEDVEPVPGDLKIGVILVGDDNEGYTYAHIEGIQKAAKALGIADEQIIWKYSVPEDETCYEAALDLADQGCTYVFSNSYGHQSFIEQAAADVPDVNFVAMTGDTAKDSGLDNFSNAFTKVYESRYISGVVAGMKLAELIEAGALSAENFDEDGNAKIGYVGAYPYAEVVSGYTAFFLGIKSVVPEVAMQVVYTNSWFDITKEGAAAEALMANGCAIIGQHADSTGAPSAIQAALEKGTVAYSVGYNVDMLSVAPDAALTSATNNWSVYYTYALTQAIKGEKIATNWAEGYETDAVAITELGASCAEGTAEKVEEAIEAIKAGELKVFDTDTFTVGGEHLDSYTSSFGLEGVELISDGYFHESDAENVRSAPAFDIRIDGITELS